MPTIFDNIENKLHEGLLRTLEASKRADFCVGYFNRKNSLSLDLGLNRKV